MLMAEIVPRLNWLIEQREAREEAVSMKAVVERGARGRATTGTMGVLDARQRTYNVNPDLLHKCYIASPYIRPCVDGITRTFKGRPWDIVPRDDRDIRDLTATENRQRLNIKQKFIDPNQNKGTWQSFAQFIMQDQLIYDAPAIELVKGQGTGTLKEMVPIYGPSIRILQDDHGVLHGYIQRSEWDGQEEKFEPDEMIFAPMFSSTKSPYGVSIIQTIIDQITYLLLMADHHSRILDRDEIPDGIVFASGVSETEFKKFVNDAKINAGKGDKLHHLGSSNPQSKIDWIQFKRASKEEQLVEIGNEAARVIVRNFGIDPTTAGLETRFGQRAKAEVEVASTESNLIKPICDHWEEQFNVNVLPLIPGGQEFKFKFQHPRERDPKKEAEANDKGIRSGQLTVQEARLATGREPYEDAPWAGRPFIQVPGVGLFFFDTGELVSKEMGVSQPSPPVQGQARASVLTVVAKNDGYVSAPKVEELIRQYTAELKSIYADFGREAMAVVSAGLVDESPILMTREMRDEKVRTIGKLREKYLDRWHNALANYAPRAARLGHDRAMLKLRVSNMTDEERQAVLDEQIEKNFDFMKDAWRKYADRLIWVVNAATEGMRKEVSKLRSYGVPVRKGPGGLPDDIVFDNVTELTIGEEAALAASISSVEAYGRYLWAVENVIYAAEAGASGMKVFWHQTSSNPCPDCEALGGQEHDPLELSKWPGEGVQCDGRCYCFLEILTEGGTI